MIWVNYNVLTT